MTEPSTPTSELPLSPTGGAARSVRYRPAVAAGLLTALAVGASVLLIPTGDSAAADAVMAGAPVRPAAAVGPALLHPVKPEPAVAAAQPVRQVRDPFRPLLTPPDEGTSAPAGSPSVSTPDRVEPAPPAPRTPDLSFPEVVVEPPAPQPPVPVGSSASVARKELELTDVEVTGERFVAVLALDGRRSRAEVGDSFGPGGQLLLLSLQQGPRNGQWTAVVQAGQGDPFDVVSGTPTRIP